MTDRLALPRRYRDQLEALLREHVPGVEVWAYGSRVNGRSHDGSDLDLVLRGPALEPLDGGFYDLLEAIEKSNIPILVQVHDWAMLPESFHREIERDYVVVQEGAKKRSTVAADGWRETDYGTFRHDFQVDSLCNLCSNESGIQTGPFGSQLHQEDYVPVGTPIITVEHLGENRIIHRDLPRVSDYDRNRLSRYTLRQGDIVFSRVGSVDRRSLVRGVEEGWLFSGRCLRVRPDVNKIDPAYLSYFFGLPAFQEHIRAIAVGATMPSLNTQILGSVSIVYPPLPEQRAIAHILGTLDDKIELNRRMNETLEAMARAIFQDWFVDFGPVRAKLEDRDPYLPPELWSLFPDRLVDSELGEIPDGWEVKVFGELLDDVIGGDWGKDKADSTNTEAVSIIRGTDIPNLRNGGVGSVPLRYTTTKKAERRILQHGDIIIEVSGGSPTQPTGRSMLVTEDILERYPTTVVCASFCRRFRPRGWIEGLVAAQHLDFVNSIGKMWEYQLQSTGISNFQTKRFLEEESIIWPGNHLADEFAGAINPIVKHATRNENTTLKEQRDALLPGLVSGVISLMNGVNLD